MSNNRQTLSIIFGVLFVLFIASTALGQQPDAALPQSQAAKIIEKIDQLEKNMLKNMRELETKFGKQMHELELKMRDHVDTKFNELNTKIDKLNEDVAFIKGQLTIIKWGIAIFGAPLLIGLILYFLQNRTQRANVTAEIATKAAENREKLDEGLIQNILRDNEPSKSEFV